MRWGLLLIVACVILALSTPGLILAADPKGEGSKVDLFAGWLDLTVWTIAVFLILFFVLNTFAWPQIRAGLDLREATIAQDKAEAVKAKHEAEAARKDLAEKMAKANDEIRAMLDKARADAQATANEEIARGKAELAAEKARLRDEMTRQKDQALQEIWAQGAGLATLISAKAIRKNLSLEDHRALVEDALKEFRSAAQTRLEDLTSARA